MTSEVRRKGVHIVLALILAGSAPYLSGHVLTGIGIGLFVLFVLIRISGIYARIDAVPRVTFGELFFALGVLGASILADSSVHVFQTSMVVLALADALAALIGVRYGKQVFFILDERRTVEGSLACFFVTASVLLFFGGTLPVALCIASVVTVVEALSLRGSDNLFIPLIVVILMQVLL